MIRGSPVEWQGSNCKNVPGDRFYPVKGRAQREALDAKAVCNGEDEFAHLGVCKWRGRCLEWAIERRERWGVWGGLSEPQRAKLIAQRRRQARDDRELIAAAALFLPKGVAAPPVLTLVPPLENDMASKLKTPRKPTGDLKRFGDARKNGRLLADMERHLLSRPQNEHRRHDMIHVSELAKNDFCPRAVFRRIKNARNGVLPKEKAPAFAIDNIWEEGDRVHGKYQSRWADMGQLWGKWECWACGHEWWDTAPEKCEKCRVRRECLIYREVPMEDEQHLLVAHADGELRPDWMVMTEIKTIGVGTIRAEMPRMLGEYTRKYTDDEGTERSYLDHDDLWRNLRTPFASHLRQGQLYLHIRKVMEYRYEWPTVEELIFIYEYKPNQAVKEFRIKYDADYVEPLLDLCKTVRWCLDNDTPPSCIKGRVERCTACQAYEAHVKDIDTGDDDGTAESPAQALGSGATGEGSRGAASAIRAAQAQGTARTGRRLNRPARRGPDGTAGPANSLGGLLRRAAGDGVDR